MRDAQGLWVEALSQSSGEIFGLGFGVKVTGMSQDGDWRWEIIQDWAKVEENPPFCSSLVSLWFLSQRTKLFAAEARTEIFQNAPNLLHQGVVVRYI